MKLFGDHQLCTVAEIWRLLCERLRIFRNMVHAPILRLEDKGWPKPSVRENRVLFSTKVTRESTQQQCVRHLIETAFDGSPEGLVLTLLNDRTVSAEEAARIQKMIAQVRRKQS